MDKSRIANKEAVDFVSKFNEIYFRSISHYLSSFVQDGFLKELFEKNPSAPVDKAQLLIRKFGDAANPANFTEQAQATNIQPTTLSLIFSIALYAASRSWENFNTQFLTEFGDLFVMSEEDVDDMFDESSVDESNHDEDLGILSEEELLKKGLQMPPPPKPAIVTPPILPDIVMTPVDLSVTPETSRKKDKQKARATDDKQVKNQSTTAKPDAKTPAKNSQKEKKSSTPEKILAELKLWGNAIKCSVKRQHKYQTLRVKIALSSFALPQFNKYWTTDLGGIPVRWFPASWTLRERKQREKFQAVIHDIPEDMTMATLWADRKPCNFLMTCGASSFKIIQTSKGRRKLVGYFENWETTLRALDTPQAFVAEGNELKWCRHSIPNLKKAQPKLKTKNTPDTKKSGNTGKVPVSNQSKKKDNTKSSKKNSENNNQVKKNPNTQKKAKNSSKKKGRNKDNKEVLAEILTLLQKLV
ncbi:unnamed protein product [Rhizophagus irregularis]|nr:unnamed protein product [Rhizophagus irregularis]